MTKFICAIIAAMICTIIAIIKRGTHETESDSSTIDNVTDMDAYIPSDVVRDELKGHNESIVESTVESARDKSNSNITKVRKRDSRGRFVKSE